MGIVKISNDYINIVKWAIASEYDYVVGNNADVWRIQISKNLNLLNTFSQLLSIDELARANKYLHPRDKNRFIISRGALRITLGKYLNLRPGLVEFKKGTNQKPFITNSQVFYNVSHSGDWIVIAVAGSEIGIDVELADASFDFKDIIKEYFSTEEINFVEQEPSGRNFFLLWTRKEALTKGTGKGLDDQLKYIPSVDGVNYVEQDILSSNNNWKVSSFEVGNNYLVSVACIEELNEINFWEANLY